MTRWTSATVGTARRFLFALAIVTFSAAACAPLTPAPAAQLEVNDVKNAEISSEIRDGVLYIDIESQQGIGAAQMTLASPNDLRDVILRLHLSGLEDLTFAYQGARVQASMGTSDRVVREQATPTGDPDAAPIDDSSPYWMNVQITSDDAAVEPTIPLESGHFTVSVPRDFLTSGSPSFDLSWVDFYR